MFKLIINFPIQIIEKDEDWMLVKNNTDTDGIVEKNFN